MRINRIHILVPLVMGLFVAFPAAAYVLPLNPLLNILQEKREESSFRNMVVEGSLVLHGRDGRSTILSARRSLLEEGRCRIDIKDSAYPEFENKYVLWDGRAVRGTDQQELAVVGLMESIACPLSAGGSFARARMENIMDRYGVDRSYTGYFRLDGRVAYAVGGRTWETETPALWFDKESYMPVRAMVRIDGASVDIRLLGHGDLVSGENHPRIIQIFLNGKLSAEFQAERIEQDVDLPSRLFE